MDHEVKKGQPALRCKHSHHWHHIIFHFRIINTEKTGKTDWNNIPQGWPLIHGLTPWQEPQMAWCDLCPLSLLPVFFQTHSSQLTKKWLFCWTGKFLYYCVKPRQLGIKAYKPCYCISTYWTYWLVVSICLGKRTCYVFQSLECGSAGFGFINWWRKTCITDIREVKSFRNTVKPVWKHWGSTSTLMKYNYCAEPF